MRLRIVTPVRTMVDTEVSEVIAPGAAGEMGVLPQHVTFLGQLDAGLVRYVAGGKPARVVIGGGYVEIVDDVVTLLADDAEFADQIDREAARVDIANVRERLSDPSASEEDISKTLAALRLAELRSTAAN
jgi:F-type H+-transporting ATPase subunit epsilon